MLADVNVLLKLEPQDAFDQWLALPGEWVEPPNIRRGGESGVKRVLTASGGVLYCKQAASQTSDDTCKSRVLADCIAWTAMPPSRGTTRSMRPRV